MLPSLVAGFHFGAMMDLTIALGWWLMPLAVTIICYGLAVANFSHARGDYSFPEVYNAMLLLVAWLIWALAS